MEQLAFTLVSRTSGEPSIRYEWSSANPAVLFAPIGITGGINALLPGAGNYTVSVVAIDRSGRSSATRTIPITVGAVVDEVYPLLRSISFAYEREQTLYLQFSEPLAAFDLSMLALLKNNTSGIDASWNDFATPTLIPGINTWKITKTTGGQVFDNGRYALVIDMGGVTDTSGLSGNDYISFEFKMLHGDATMDGTVNFDDLVSLAQHYNLTDGATWSMGDFNYDGVVNFDDLAILAQMYGQTVNV